MLEEIRRMKELNFNAVRTSHYPDDPVWYDLCDKYGILVVCASVALTSQIRAFARLLLPVVRMYNFGFWDGHQ
jgi:hypothetical protein